jgi:hypothetical protein
MNYAQSYLSHFKKNLYFFPFLSLCLLLLLWADRGVFFIFFYYADPFLWLEHFPGFTVLFFYFGIFSVGLIILKGVESWNAKKFTKASFFRFSLTLFVFYSLSHYGATVLLDSEVLPSEYRLLGEKARIGDVEHQRSIAQMLENDCRITLKEAHSHQLIKNEPVSVTPEKKEYIDCGVCTIENEEKGRLLRYFSEKYIAIYR